MSTRNHTPRHLLAAIVCLALVVGGCTKDGNSGRDLATILVVPDQVPAGMGLQGGCATEALGAAVLAYRGDGRYKSERRIESAYLRVMAFDLDERPTLDDPDFDVDSVLDDAMPGSISDVTVRGRPATEFLIGSGEDPGSHGWPALVWSEGDLVFVIYGEGLDETAVEQVAESLRPSTNEEYFELVDQRRCGS